MLTFLDFEKPIAELETRVAELRETATAGSIDIDSEIARLEAKSAKLLRETYARLTPWQKSQVARHPERPHFNNYVAGIADDFVPLAGDRAFGDDPAIIGGLGRIDGRRVMIIGHEKGDDIGGDEETILAKNFDRPVMVHRYPAAVKAFYMKPDPNRPDVALGVDVLAPEGYGEIIGGGERLSDYDLLLQRIKEHNLPQEAFEWYLDLRRYGSVPHGGFGMGIERVVSWICGLDHLREAIPYPRMLYRIYP